MKFKDFLKMTEAPMGASAGGGGGDNGLMGLPVPSSVRKPSDGQPFKQWLGPASGQTPRGNTGGGSPMGGQPAMFMKRKMKKK